jgi:hypothetical protein
MYEKILAAPVGSTGSQTHASVELAPYDTIAFQFVVEVAGATPSVTWKIQGSVDENIVSDANSNWYDVFYVTDSSDTGATTAITQTTLGAKLIFLDNPVARRYRKFRVVSSANTNVTYRCEAHRVK